MLRRLMFRRWILRRLNDRRFHFRRLGLFLTGVFHLFHSGVDKAKGALIKKALGITDTSIKIEEDKVLFPWFPEMPEPDEAKAYTEFIAAICRMSKEQKRVSATERPTDNEKFTFRVFLIRLGFIGDEYKTTRRILLRNLSGNSAWRNGAPKKEVEADD